MVMMVCGLVRLSDLPKLGNHEAVNIEQFDGSCATWLSIVSNVKGT